MPETEDLILSEDDFLSMVDRYFELRTPHQLTLRGDDCAELAMPPEICLSSDLFLEDIHFRTSYFNFYEIGHKALAVNLSDLASAGARPLGFNMNLTLPAATPRAAVEELLRGMSALAARYRLPLTGGDLSGSPASGGGKLGLCISIWGEKGGARFLRRGECRPGDTLFLLGGASPEEQSGQGRTALPLGLARIGLAELEEHGRETALALAPESVRRHLLPEPQIATGLALAQIAPQASLMDVSDGLARDLPRLLGHNQGKLLGAALEIDPHTLHSELLARAANRSLNPLREAFLGGEDYLLLASHPYPDLPARLRAHLAAQSVGTADQLICQPIGRVQKNGPVTLNGICLEDAGPGLTGFDHFNANHS